MFGTLYRFFAEDHDRLDGLLRRSITESGAIDRDAYAEFRAGLLKHISMEEKILLPAVQGLRGGDPLAVAATLRLDHSALAALLVPTPTRTIIAAIRAILGPHNAREEGSGGVYECCEQLVGAETEALLVTWPRLPLCWWGTKPTRAILIPPPFLRTLEALHYSAMDHTRERGSA